MMGRRIEAKFRSRNIHLYGSVLDAPTLHNHKNCIKPVNEVHCVTGFVRIRHYGVLANRCKAKALRQCRQALGQPPDPPVPEPKSMAQWMQQWTGIDITCCPQCGYQPLLRTPLPVAGGTVMTRAP